MRIIDLSLKILGLSEAIGRWQGALAELDRARRLRIAGYLDSVAASLARAGDALRRQSPDDLAREIGRLTGYLEDMAAAVEDRLDGRRIAGVKRRLAAISEAAQPAPDLLKCERRRARLLEAEGYFRALADGLRV